MISAKQALSIAKEALPHAKINAQVEYQDLYIFHVTRIDLPHEEDYDPFYSVDRSTGEFQDFSLLIDGNANEILALFDANQKGASS